jgi:predicted nucleic acid-binding protein
MLDEYGFVERCDDYDRSVVEFLVAGRRNRERGEAETVVQAVPINATVVVDDPWGRELAASYRLEHHGTVWILRRLKELGFINAPNVRDHFVD